ncbi:Alpha/Beta hydrolase protein [Gorgonomyces haynaldii]|nr:Alpha/Beta hydrolase protein [Gorgonomyces haynaldii]
MPSPEAQAVFDAFKSNRPFTTKTYNSKEHALHMNGKEWELSKTTLVGKQVEMHGLRVWILGNGKQVMYLHGGGFTKYLEQAHLDWLHELSQKCQVIVPLYRKAPGYSAEDSLEPLYKIYHEFQTQTLIGDSAGGNLCLVLTMMLRDRNSRLPKQLLLWSPWVELSMTSPYLTPNVDPWLYDKYLAQCGGWWAGKMDVKDWRVSPLYGSFHGLESIQMVVWLGEYDLLTADAALFCEKAKAQGCRLQTILGPEMLHGWMLFDTPEARKAKNETLSFLFDARL